MSARQELEGNFVSSLMSAMNGRYTSIVSDAAAICPAEAVLSSDLREVVSALYEMSAMGRQCNLVGLFEYMRERHATDPEVYRHVDADYIDRLTTTLWRRPEDVVMFATRLRDEHMRTSAEPELLRLAGLSRQYGVSPDEIADGARALAESMHRTEKLAGMGDLLNRVVDKVRNGTAAAPLPTPWANLNRVLKGGLVPGEMAVLAARPGLGKTALAGCISVELARRGKPVLFISREVKDETIAARIIAREAKVDNRVFREGIEGAHGIIPKLEHAAYMLQPLPLHIVEKSVAPMTPREVRRLARGMKDIGLVVIDYLQLLNPDNKYNSREREVAEMSRSMKQLALDCNCPVLVLSQLNRSKEESDREPILSDLRESGALEQDADIVIFLHTKRVLQQGSTVPVKAIVAKGRSSGTGAAHLVFEKPFSDFAEDFSDGAKWGTADSNTTPAQTSGL